MFYLVARITSRIPMSHDDITTNMNMVRIDSSIGCMYLVSAVIVFRKEIMVFISPVKEEKKRGRSLFFLECW